MTTQANTIKKAIWKNALNNLDVLYDFDNPTEEEFKECYGFTKEQIRSIKP